MGNSQSSISSREGMLLLLHRTWAVVIANRIRSSKRDVESDYGSQYSWCSCNQCCTQNLDDDDLDDLSLCASEVFGKGSTMAPNSETSSRIGSFNWSEDTLGKEKQRPPIYNPEDYAMSLRKWSRKSPATGGGLYGIPNEADNNSRSPHSSLRDYRNPMLTTPVGAEMTLRQFGTVSELLSKLRADLRLAYPSFVQEFIGDPLDGVTLLLELLRAVQLSQASSTGQGTNTTRVPPSIQRRALLDELACLQCLLYCCLRFAESVHQLTSSSAGLFTLAVCIMSNVNKARIIALQLLTKTCEPAAAAPGHSAVSEALSTLRLRFGEPVRFRFLVGMLTSAGGQCELLAAGVKFLNTFLESAGTRQRRLYIQAELEQAGFDVQVIKKIISINSPSAELVFQELDRWERNHIDVETLSVRVVDAEKENDSLRDKLLLLERRVQILQEEKGILVSLEQCLKERCSELQDEVTSLKSGKSPNLSNSHNGSSRKGDSSTPAEDEGISSSERSLSPDEELQREPSVYEMYSVQSETIIIKGGAEENAKNALNSVCKKSQKPQSKISTSTNSISKHSSNSEQRIHVTAAPEVLKHKQSVTLVEDEDEEETTIEEVMEELRNIINDAETEAYAAENAATKKKKQEDDDRKRRIALEEQQIAASKIQMRVDSNVLIDDPIYGGGGGDGELEIVPTNLHPQPPRRTRSLVHLFIPTEDYDYANVNKEIFFENETPYTSDESSDSLLSASRCQLPRIEKDIPCANNMNQNRAILNTIMDARERATLQEKRRLKKSDTNKRTATATMKRSESFQQAPPPQHLNSASIPIHHQSPPPVAAMRHNSFDGLYCVTELAHHNNGNGTTHQHPQQLQHHHSRRSSQHQLYEDRQHTIQKKKSKSLDRIDDGLDSMVDIVVMEQRIAADSDKVSGSSRLRPKSDSGNATATTLSRSVSNVFSGGSRKLFTSNKAHKQQQDAKEERNRMFLPNHRFEQRDTGETHYYFPRVQETGSFLIKRGHANAGLYSGQQHLLRDRDNHCSRKSSNVGSDFRTMSSMSSRNHVVAAKVTDMPSGLY